MKEADISGRSIALMMRMMVMRVMIIKITQTFQKRVNTNFQ